MKRSRQEENENMACEICLGKFSFLKKKKECFECRGDCCSSCLVKEQGKNTCKRCSVLLAVPPDPIALMRLKAKDLKLFLGRKHISHQQCTQKDELVELVVQMAVSTNRRETPATSPRSTDSRQNSERLASSSLNSSEQSSGDHNPQSSSPYEEPSSQPPPHTADEQRESDRQASYPSQQLSGKSEESLASLENLLSEDAIDSLSVRQLKLLLLRHFVDYRGCCEKVELQERVRRLWRQHKLAENVDLDALPNDQLCKICWESPINCVLLECGHMATCTECGKRMHECPICRQYVVRVVHTFRA